MTDPAKKEFFKQVLPNPQKRGGKPNRNWMSNVDFSHRSVPRDYSHEKKDDVRKTTRKRIEEMEEELALKRELDF